MKEFIRKHPARLIVAGIGLLLFFWASPLCTGRYNEGSVAGMALGGLVTVLGIGGVTPKKAYHCGHGVRRAVCAIAATVILIGLLGTAGAATFIAVKAITPPADGEQTVIVLGCAVNGETPSPMLTWRLDAAAAYLEAHPDTTAILAGGQGFGEAISEAEAMRRYLTAAGIAEQRLILEEQSENTAENLRYSAAIIEQRGLPRQVAVVTQSYHQGRAALHAAQAGLKPGAVVAPCRLNVFFIYFMREILGVGEYVVSTILGVRLMH